MLSAQEKRILRSIRVPSENDPTKPEFPPEHPCFPSTPTIRIHVPGFTNVWLKDESVNPTGTHKDRMAWEMVVTYRQLLQNKSHSPWMKKLPALSILSSGSAAFAIQHRLRQYRLPPLRVLMDLYTDQSTLSVLRKVGCRVYLHPLAQDPLTWRDILRLTENEDGFDITSNTALDPTIRFYDWMSYEPFFKEAMQIAKAQEIQAEPSGLAGLALLLQEQKHLPRKAKYLIVSTGRCVMYDKHV